MLRPSQPTCLPSSHSRRIVSEPSMKSDSLLWPKLSWANTPATVGESTQVYSPGSTGTACMA